MNNNAGCYATGYAAEGLGIPFPVGALGQVQPVPYITTAKSAPPPKFGLAEALNDQNAIILELHQTISMLFERLDPVLGTPEPNGMASKEGPMNPNKMLHQVQNHNALIREARYRLTDILDRIEL
jgi:hypothetical protein